MPTKLDSNNPIAKLFNDGITFYFTPYTNEEAQKIANDVIKDYIDDNFSQEKLGDITKNVNEFITQYNEKHPNNKVDFKVETDDKGNIFAKRGYELVKIYANEVDDLDARRYVSDTSYISISDIASRNNNIEPSERELLDLVKALKNSGADVSVSDINKAYDIISNDGKISKDESDMFKALVSINDDISVTEIKGLGKVLIHERDDPTTTKKYAHDTGEVEYNSEDKASLVDRYKDTSTAVVKKKITGLSL